MNKQEEIREGIARRLLMIGTGNPDFKMAEIILEYLHSQGVVLKVERELPENPARSLENPYEPIFSSRDKNFGKAVEWESKHCSEGVGYKNAQEDMLKAGYVAVESLIKVIDNEKDRTQETQGEPTLLTVRRTATWGG